MDKRETKVESLLKTINRHDINEIVALMQGVVEWGSIEGPVLSSSAGVMKMWQDRWTQYPDFQVEMVRFDEVPEKSFLQLKYFGSAGSNKTIDMSFTTTVLLELTWDAEQITHGREFGDPGKMLELAERLCEPEFDDSYRVSGFGGVFLKVREPRALAAWYDEHLGTRFGKNAWSTFKWRERDNKERIGRTEFSLFGSDTTYFEPSESGFMLNFRVHNLEELLRRLTEKNIKIVGDTQVFEYGKFAWIMDPEGNKVELWEPKDGVLESFDTA